MRLGLVRYLNARPLDYGFRQDLAGADLLEDTPARLVNELLAGRLDAALISSVECLRNADRLGSCLRVGVCARREVRSILFFARKGDVADPTTADFRRVYVDRGSRSSVALLKVLLRRRGRTELPEFEERDPAAIPDLVRGDCAGLLIGDGAMDFRYGPRFGEFDCRDLAGWWHEREGLPFVFALWAYPRERPLPDDLFQKSLDRGLENLEKIAGGAGYPEGLEYLRDILHYRLDDADRRSLTTFHDYLRSAGF